MFPALLAVAAALACPPANFSSVATFDLDAYIAKRWYIQQQAALIYLPASQNRCVYAEYKEAKHFWGYEISVHNHAEEVKPPHKPFDSGSYICAKIVDADRGQLKVGPCFLPTFLAGKYWVLAFDDAEGYALISGGPPTVAAPGGCQNTNDRTNGAGLWIFTREQQRTPAVEALIAKARGLAKAKGFDLSVLNDVDHVGCDDEAMVPMLV